MSDETKPPSHADVGLNKMAEKPGQTCWTASWDDKECSYTIKIDNSWWGPTGNTMVVVDGVAMTRREADIQLWVKRLHQIAGRKPPKPVNFT